MGRRNGACWPPDAARVSACLRKHSACCPRSGCSPTSVRSDAEVLAAMVSLDQPVLIYNAFITTEGEIMESKTVIEAP